MGGVASHEPGKLVGKKQIARNEYAYYVTRRDLELTHAERPPTPVWLPSLSAADPVYFVFERLSDASIEFWDRYGLLQERKTRLGIVPIGEGLVAFSGDDCRVPERVWEKVRYVGGVCYGSGADDALPPGDPDTAQVYSRELSYRGSDTDRDGRDRPRRPQRAVHLAQRHFPHRVVLDPGKVP